MAAFPHIKPDFLPENAAPFAIGLRPLDLSDWLDVDTALPAYLDEKERLFEIKPDEVFAAEPDTEEAQREVLELILAHLEAGHSQTHQRTGSRVIVRGIDRSIDIDGGDQPALWTAARLIQDDLVLMRKSEAGWRLVAGSVCFPSSWNLREKFSKPLHAVHAPVPGFQEGSRNALLIERIFDHLQVEQPVERFNWSIYEDSELHHPVVAGRHGERGLANGIGGSYLRLERQTLRKLAISGDILFTIRIYIEALPSIAARKDCGLLVDHLMAGLQAMSGDELRYKNLTDHRDRLLNELGAMR